ncbi:MAG TPA: hypothetical protein VIF12_02780, partial [Micavibrio sp.]
MVALFLNQVVLKGWLVCAVFAGTHICAAVDAIALRVPLRPARLLPEFYIPKDIKSELRLDRFKNLQESAEISGLQPTHPCVNAADYTVIPRNRQGT